MSLIPELHNFIGGAFVPPRSNLYLDNINPATGDVISRVARSAASDVDDAVQAARRAFPAWRNTAPAARAHILETAASLIQSRLAELALAESNDTGKPLQLSSSLDIPRAVANLRFFAGAILHSQSGTYEMIDPPSINFSLRQPVGVAALIVPWNLPLYQLTWKVAPALACGNTVVCKPSELTPTTANMLADILREAGLPAGVYNVVHGLGPEAGQALTEHRLVRLVSFTGGTATGVRVGRTCADTFKKTSLELGGKNSAIVFADCDFEKTIEQCSRSGFLNSGQVCLCCSRILVQRPLFERFLQAYVAKVGSIVVGDPLDSNTQMGSVISADHLKKIESYIERARAEGGTVHCGGGRAPIPAGSRCSRGYFIQPTVVSGLAPSHSCSMEEVFGPFVTVHPFDTEEEAIEMANMVQYGLCASVWTNNMKVGHRVARALDVGSVWVNCWLRRDLRVPFGGQKDSGLGREGGEFSIDFFTELKNVCIALEP